MNKYLIFHTLAFFSWFMDVTLTPQAENSALLLANESQREAYERCLDEVRPEPHP